MFGRRGFNKVDEAVEDADLALEFYRVDKGFVGNLYEVETHKFEDEDGDVDYGRK